MINLDDLEFRVAEEVDSDGNYQFILLYPYNKETKEEYVYRVNDIFNGNVNTESARSIELADKVSDYNGVVFKLQPFLIPRLLVCLNNVWANRGKNEK